MKVKSAIILLVAGLLLIAACSSNKPAKHGLSVVFQPSWYQLQGDAEYIYTYGQAEKASQNASETAAYANAMQEAAQYVEARVQSMIKNYIEEAGVVDPQVLALTSSVTRVVANADFTGSQISKREAYRSTNDRYKTFVRVSIPQNTVNRNLAHQIRNEEALYNQFKASQAFQELDQILDKQQ